MAKATQTAIEVSHAPLASQLVNSFVSELTLPQQTLVREKVAEIIGAQQAIVQGRITIGKALAELNHALGHEDFDKFCKAVGTKLGLSRSTAYRYLAGYKMVHGQFGQVANTVLALTDGGNSIVKTDPKSGKIDLTPEAKTVMAKMPKLADKATADDREQWARTFASQVVKEGRSSSSKSILEVIKDKVDNWESRAIAEDDKGCLIARISRVEDVRIRISCVEYLQEALDAIGAELESIRKTISATPVGKAETLRNPKPKKTKVTDQAA